MVFVYRQRSMVRYRHNDLVHLTQLLQKYHADDAFERIIVVT